MAYNSGLIFDNVRIELGQGFNQELVMMSMLDDLEFSICLRSRNG
jgi:hypothetical protein